MIKVIVIGNGVSAATAAALHKQYGQEVMLIPFEAAWEEMKRQVPEPPKIPLLKIQMFERPAQSGRERRRWRRENERRRQ